MKHLFIQDSLVLKEKRLSVVKQKPFVFWLTGLSGSGKSTIAKHLESALISQGKNAYFLDADNLRISINNDLGFSLEDRRTNVRRIAYIAQILFDAGVIPLVSCIAPFAEDRQFARDLIGKDFVECFCASPLDVCEERDIKGLYKRARSGELKQFTGIDSPYDIPLHPDIFLKTDQYSIEECISQIGKKLTEFKYIEVDFG